MSNGRSYGNGIGGVERDGKGPIGITIQQFARTFRDTGYDRNPAAARQRLTRDLQPDPAAAPVTNQVFIAILLGLPSVLARPLASPTSVDTLCQLEA